ncbi:type II toxin-antitoxin system RelE/ParE family toxin [bacterium]|nr:type II toxin-antitoxin system RelE/ParE family toxin [bacterium]
MFEIRLLSQPENPSIKKIKGFDNLFRYRIGSLRIVYSVDMRENIVLVQTILPRGDVYKKI